MIRTLMAAGVTLGLASVTFGQELQPRLGDPVQGLTPGQYQRFRRGMTVFNTNLTPAEGLGPAFNDISCGSCHSGPLPGGGSVRTVTRFGLAASGGNPFDPLGHLGGSLLQSVVYLPGQAGMVPLLECSKQRGRIGAAAGLALPKHIGRGESGRGMDQNHLEW